MIRNRKIAFIGAGFMGGALIRGLTRSRTVDPKQITASDPRDAALSTLASEIGVTVAKDNSTAVADADIVVFAVKPQIMENVVRDLARKIGKKKLVISIAAGVKTTAIASWLPSGARIVRAMPNMPAAVEQSASAICAGGSADNVDVLLARQMFDAVGETIEVDEKLMDAVTGLSGSGPAFVFLFLEAMIDAGVRVGLDRASARTLAAQTLYGSAKMAKISAESPSSLKDRITSPGGTTIAGLAELEDRAFRGAVIRAVEAAVHRSKELGE